MILSHAALPHWVDAADDPAHSFPNAAQQFVDPNLSGR